MMTTQRGMSLIAGLVAAMGLAACGESGSEYADAVPSYSMLAMDMQSSDLQQTQSLLPGAPDGGSDDPNCHPHLFQRTREVVQVINRHTFKVFGRLARAMDDHPDQSAGSSRIWTRNLQSDGVTLQTTVDKTATNAYTFQLQFKPLGSADSTYVKIVTGNLNVTGSGEGNGTLNFDFSALQQAIPSEQATGQFSMTYNLSGTTKTIDVALTNFIPDSFILDPEGNPIRPPRSGEYVFQRTEDVGGSLKFEEDVELLCPHTPTLVPDGTNPSTVETVARWGVNSSGQHVGRADSIASGGGNIPSGDQWQGVTCFTLDDDSEGLWEMQDQTLAGGVVNWFASSVTTNDGSASSPCDPLFAPNPDGTQANFNLWSGLSSVSFTDTSVVAYPGEPSGS